MANKALRIFYSWQTDSPADTNRNAIRVALKTAAKRLEAARPGLKIERTKPLAAFPVARTSWRRSTKRLSSATSSSRTSPQSPPRAQSVLVQTTMTGAPAE